MEDHKRYVVIFALIFCFQPLEPEPAASVGYEAACATGGVGAFEKVKYILPKP